MSAVFLKILNMGITASWLILAVFLTRQLLKKAPKWVPCLLWGLVAIRLICPFSFESVISLIPSTETIPVNIAQQHEPAITSGITIVNEVVNPIVAKSFTTVSADNANPLQNLISVAAIVWIAGIIIMLTYALFSYLKLKKTVSVCVPVGERLLACDEVRAPFILGVFRPVIYIPSSMSGDTLEYAIRHEKAHLQRHDHWWKPLGFLLLSVYWFNPLCWIAYILLCRDIEMACDEKVICDMDKDDMAAYSQALLDSSFPRKQIAACPLAFGEVGVKERVKGVLNYKKPAFWIILVAVIACIVLAVCLMTDPLSDKGMSEKLGVSMNKAVAEHARSSNSEDRFIAADYDVLLVSESGHETTVYAWVLYEEYSFNGSDAKLETGSHIPAAITFDTSSNDNDSSTYDVIEYWEPRNGSHYAEDIQAKFPWSIRGKALDKSKSKANLENSLHAAREYFGVNESELVGKGFGNYYEIQDLRMDILRFKYPDYFDLNTSNGLVLYVWQMSPNIYSCGLMIKPNRDRTLEELMNLKGASIAEMRVILSSYDIDEKDILIAPWQNPVSSYLSDYWVSQIDEDPASVEKRRQEYIDGIRQMLFGAELSAPVIDAASLDIDNDGIYEYCTLTYGPTSGLFTVVITASYDGKIKYKNTFNMASGTLSFAEKDGTAQLVRNNEYHRLYVEENRIVIESLDPQYEGYWGGPEWNFNLK
jgi:beta-lactamase regulating signal transducer with metallopeptidase domain